MMLEQLGIDVAAYPKLSYEQAGHIRHFHNLAAQLDGDWRYMGNQEPAQEWLDALRYQLATMAYASGAAHYHRLPALRSIFKPLIRRLIQKMLHRAVWGYWFTTSLSGTFVDPSLTELRKPWADPVVRENIMYSGHLLLMVSLYAMLFDDDEFERPGSLQFNWDPVFFGFGSETFVYDRRTLQTAILKEMERNEWMGVCCEPNSVFIVCNQFPLIAIRYNDVRDGTKIIDPVLEKYQTAWKDRQMVAPNGLYVDWWQVKQDEMRQPTHIGFTAWANAFMNTWNSDFVYASFSSQALGFITATTGALTIVNTPSMAAAIRQLVAEGAGDPSNPDVIQKAYAIAAEAPPSKAPYSQPTFGYVAMWLSELGRESDLQGLLQYANRFFNPTFTDGGLYYPRNDAKYDADGNDTFVDPFTGNAAIAYARLNIADGQKTMWQKPWTGRMLKDKPWVDNVGLDEGVDFLRGKWDEKAMAMVMTMRSWSGKTVIMKPTLRNLMAGNWSVYVNGLHTRHVKLQDKNMEIVVEVEVRNEEVDVVVAKTGEYV
ncbi:hypothetical protein V501_01892 [Pseudogymnoascus sp. VKM F-4519 (FW-2642)]|nr:hypothetical protein V500_03153 [Pseudogymnoascus sp. VKM F-4518 (FW-2643)]KFZ17101.1 hypothetical protein V501_01892 [Pseudogymnoascus sp. VKM F-4519 (FW-2642)]